MNSVGTDLDFSRGAVAQKIKAAAGEKIEQEAKKQKPNGIKPGEYVATSSGNLAARGVLMLLHTTIHPWPSGPEQNQATAVHFFYSFFSEFSPLIYNFPYFSCSFHCNSQNLLFTYAYNLDSLKRVNNALRLCGCQRSQFDSNSCNGHREFGLASCCGRPMHVRCNHAVRPIAGHRRLFKGRSLRRL